MAGYTYKYNKVTQTKYEIDVEINEELIEPEKEKQLAKQGKKLKLPGFRPGKAPAAMVEGMLGADLYDEILRALLPQVTLEILKEKDVEPITQIKYDVSDFDPYKKLTYKATFYVAPEVKLPDFSKIKVQKDTVEVTDKEMEELMIDYYKTIERVDNKEIDKLEDKEVLEKINDEWAQKLKLDEIKSVEELKAKFKDQLAKRKEMTVKEKYLNDIIDKAIEMTDFEVPEDLVENDVHSREHSDRERLENVGIKWEDWLRQQKTTPEQYHEDLHKSVEKNWRVYFILNKVSDVNKFTISDDEVKEFAKGLGEWDKVSESTKRYLASEIISNKAIDWIVKEVEK